MHLHGVVGGYDSGHWQQGQGYRRCRLPVVCYSPSCCCRNCTHIHLHSMFNFFFSVGWLAIPWLYPAEIAPLQIRAKAAALATVRISTIRIDFN